MKRAYRNRDLIASLDGDRDFERIYQLTTLYDFATDARVGLNLAFYRIFAIPRIAELLLRTGEITNRPVKRAYDTGLVMYELITNGFDHPRGREMVRLLNRVHRRWPILDEDYQYVLNTFIVVPIRWIERRGWRPVLPVEREASHRFYIELGRRMRIPDLPVSFDDAGRRLDAYELENMEASHSGHRLMSETQKLVVRKIPRPLRILAPAITSALLDEPPLSSALGLPRSTQALGMVVDSAFWTRNVVHRLKKPASAPWFEPGRPVKTLYPKGYRIADLGPLPGGVGSGQDLRE